MWVDKKIFETMRLMVSHCWLDLKTNGLPPPFEPVLVGVDIGISRKVYNAFVTELGEWEFPEFQGDPDDIKVLMWMPRPQALELIQVGATMFDPMSNKVQP